MIKRILVPLDGSSFSRTATKHACEIALLTGGEVFGKAVIDKPKSVAASAPPHALAARYAAATGVADRKEDTRRVREALVLFAKACAEAGVPHHEARIQGVPVDIVTGQSIFYDLVVTGFHGEYGVNEEQGEKSVGDMLGNSITPFLIVPAQYKKIKNVLVCFDGSLASMRSLQDFAGLAGLSKFDVTVLTADKQEEEAAFLLRRASDYLRSYGVEACRTVAEPGHIRDLVAGAYADRFDLIVLGAHSRKALRDFFLGSLVIDLLNRSETPVFLGH